MRLFVVASLLLFVSMATAAMGSLLVVDVESAPVCNPLKCDRACGRLKLYGCCRGVNRAECHCRHKPGCPRSDWPLVINDVKDEVCDNDSCAEHCRSKNQYGCCAGYPGRCECRDAPICPYYVTVEIPENEDVVVKKSIAWCYDMVSPCVHVWLE